MSEYPTDEDLERIAGWPLPCTTESAQAWFDFIASIWWMPDWGWSQNGDTFSISTGGWSGNEDIIGAMGDNFIYWGLCWETSRRGGHYTFKLPSKETGKPTPPPPAGGRDE